MVNGQNTKVGNKERMPPSPPPPPLPYHQKHTVSCLLACFAYLGIVGISHHGKRVPKVILFRFARDNLQFSNAVNDNF